MPENKDVLRSLAEALDAASDETRAYLIGFAEGLIDGRKAQTGA